MAASVLSAGVVAAPRAAAPSGARARSSAAAAASRGAAASKALHAAFAAPLGGALRCAPAHRGAAPARGRACPPRVQAVVAAAASADDEPGFWGVSKTTMKKARAGVRLHALRRAAAT
jgi:hypothetical protein